MSSELYPSDLTDTEWQYLEPLLPPAKSTGRPRQWPLRLIVNGILYLVRSGCAWRLLPREYPPWPMVHDYYRRWRRDGTWERIHAQIREQVRQVMGREATPSGAVIDSQSIKTTQKGGAPGAGTIGYDGHKKVKGRKRHLLVDTQGLVLKVKVTGANASERTNARQLLESAAPEFPRLQILWADQGYRGEEAWVQEHLGWHLEVVRRTTETQQRKQIGATARQRQRAGATVLEMWAGLQLRHGIEVLPRRWVVERTFAWFSKCRRLSRDYEFLVQSSECMIYLTMMRLMLKRLDKFSMKSAF